MQAIDKIEKIRKEIIKRSKIWISLNGVKRILSAIKTTSNQWLIIRYSYEPINVVNTALNILKEERIVKVKDENVYFTNIGKKLIKELEINKIENTKCVFCEGRGFKFNFDKNLFKKFFEIQKQRPKPMKVFDQGNVTPQTTFARISLAYNFGDIQNKEILILGAEDDLLGLAIAMTGKAKSVTILDIDKRLIDFDNFWAKKLNLKLNAFVFDLRKKLPNDLLGKFDTFFTDPSETVQAIKGFILKGVASLKGPGCVGYFGFTLKDSSLVKWYQLEKILNKNKIVITEILPDFNHYENWPYLEETRSFKNSLTKKNPNKIIWYTSHWYRIVTLEGFKRVNIDLTKFSGKKFYDDIENSTS